MDTSPDWRRLHPATVLVEVVHRIMGLAWFVIIAVLLLISGGRPRTFEYILAAMAAVQVLSPIHTYLTLRYTISGGSLVVRSGLLFRRVRTIALERVQHINLQRNILHRLFGVVAMTVETAGGGQAEARLGVISDAEAQSLRAELLRHRGDAVEEAQAAPSEVLWTASLRDLFILGATENRIAYIMGGLAALLQTAQEILGERWAQRFEDTIESSVDVDRLDPVDVAVFIAWVAAALLAAGTLVSIGLTFLTHCGFVLRRGDGKLRRQYGFFTQHETDLPIRRVQVVRIDRPWLRRLLGYATVYVETAGSAAPDARQHGGTTPLCPLIHDTQVGQFVALPFEGLDLHTVIWNPVSRLTIRRGFVRYSLLGLIVLSLLGAWLTWEVMYTLPLVLVAAYSMAVARYRGLGYAEVGRYVLVRAGVWTRRTWVVPSSKIQSLAMAQSPLQRRYGLANLTLSTAGAGPLRHPTVFDLELPRVRALQDRLSTATHAAGEWLLDGV
jgi:putative membrane protein